MIPHLTDWLRTGIIAPLRWDDSLAEIVAVWPAARQEAEEAKAAKYPYLLLDCIELYFEYDDTFSGLQEIVVKVWAIEPGAPAPFLAYDWLHQDLSFAQVKTKLTTLGVGFKIEYGPHHRTPIILTPGGTLFAFNTVFDDPEETELLKIYFSREPIRVH